MAETVNEHNGNQEMGQCVKCTSSIPVEADRCVECGYELGPGILGGVVMWISGMLGSVFVTIAAVTLLLIVDGFPVFDGLIVFLFTGGIGAVLLGIVYAGFSASRRGPTEQPFGENNQSISDSWDDASERGEELGNRINNISPAIIAALPPWTWTAGVVLGAILNLSLWIATLNESELGMSVEFIGGLFVAFAAVVVDTHRIKWSAHDYSPRWWFWTVFAMIPLFGWVFAGLWLVRKRQKTGSIIG